MAPEQAKGRAADKRADIWAFGVVLYEMLTGRRLFEAEDISETLAAVLTRDVSMTTLPDAIPRRLRTLLRDCLVRDPSSACATSAMLASCSSRSLQAVRRQNRRRP
jgi:serine/threonine-protein kinase